MFVEVAVSGPFENTFTYSSHKNLQVRIGLRVKVNFNNREVIGYVVGIHNEPVEFEVKEILSVIDENPIFDDRLIELAKKIADENLSYIGEVLSMALPSGKPSVKKTKPLFSEKSISNSLSLEQEKIYEDIISSDEKYHLIFGVTGSGKTEIYIKLAEHIIKQGKSVIYLVPEISLSSQIFMRLAEYFTDQLVLYHSGITPNERFNSWQKFYSGEAKIVVGVRSACFMQCPNLGMIILDEENDSSYKENSSPRYNARRVAFIRSKDANALVVLGSATPSVESFYACEKGVIKLHKLMSRFGKGGFPTVETVKINSLKPNKIISPKLKVAVKDAVDKGEQVILLLNRRGFSPIVVCEECGKVFECPDCSVSLNYHKTGRLVCHYCGKSEPFPKKCSSCDSEKISKIGLGTQRLEDIIAAEFQMFRIARLDHDSASQKGYTLELIDKMQKSEIDVLLGTQMVAKGFDFSKVSVVGIVLADMGLNFPDYRSQERIFSLIVQASGRCGRGEEKGKVILQIFQENQVFEFAKKSDYELFYKTEIEIRKLMNYPPFTRLARLLVRGLDEDKVKTSALELKEKLVKNKINYSSEIEILGPVEAPIAKIGKNFRHHIIIKSKNVSQLRELIRTVRNVKQGLYLEIDIDPVELL
jgi:primosomal protein N' (replication factor Y)